MREEEKLGTGGVRVGRPAEVVRDVRQDVPAWGENSQSAAVGLPLEPQVLASAAAFPMAFPMLIYVISFYVIYAKMSFCVTLVLCHLYL